MTFTDNCKRLESMILQGEPAHAVFDHAFAEVIVGCHDNDVPSPHDTFTLPAISKAKVALQLQGGLLLIYAAWREAAAADDGLRDFCITQTLAPAYLMLLMSPDLVDDATRVEYVITNPWR